MKRSLGNLIAMGLIVGVAGHAKAGTITIDVPGSTFTAANGINDANQIVGQYASPPESFLLSGGSYTTFSKPGASSVAFSGINNASQIVGTYSALGVPEQGFLLSGG